MTLQQLPGACGRHSLCRSVSHLPIRKPLLDGILVKPVETGRVHQPQFNLAASAEFEDTSFRGDRTSAMLHCQDGPEMHPSLRIVKRPLHTRPAVIIGVRVPRGVAVHDQLPVTALHAVRQLTVQYNIRLDVICRYPYHYH